jgi:hypothetical protein
MTRILSGIWKRIEKNLVEIQEVMPIMIFCAWVLGLNILALFISAAMRNH